MFAVQILIKLSLRVIWFHKSANHPERNERWWWRGAMCGRMMNTGELVDWKYECYQPFVVCDRDGATEKLFASRRCWVGVGESPLPAFELVPPLGVTDCEPPPIEAIAKLLLLINPLLLISLPDKRDDSSNFCCADVAEPVVVSPDTSIGWCAWYMPVTHVYRNKITCILCIVVCFFLHYLCHLVCVCVNMIEKNKKKRVIFTHLFFVSFSSRWIGAKVTISHT